jgi:signal transduction histidine kinase
LSGGSFSEVPCELGADQLTNLGLSEDRTARFSWPLIFSRRQQDAEVSDSGNLTVSNPIAEETSRSAVDHSLMAAADPVDPVVPDDMMLRIQRLAGVGTLTAGVAQELANPIGFVTATCANLLDRLASGDIDNRELIQAIKQIEQNAYRSARIVEVLGNYANDNSAESSVDKETGGTITSPAAVVQDALILVERQFRKQSGILIETDLEPGLTTIFADHNALTQVLVNLLANARDAMPANGGTIRVRFWVPDRVVDWRPGSGSQGESIWPPESQPGDLFAFSVMDSGKGIDPHVHDRIFDPFFSTRNDGRHAGLGLTIARAIVEQHRGRIWAANNPTDGATVTIVMPRRRVKDG